MHQTLKKIIDNNCRHYKFHIITKSYFFNDAGYAG